ncbi:hypothetical protein K488DRAFT_85468 [Vararia minispora EC-137]|uniref:Uncharacterized protein n=1 Tax=Vararia minispora EC-137 TaxID=1314806 RepID=A0ACB8QM08_9AGAM|nr:hypothetical protein K488DRAFT_85468 [Vararia minispora EC-137]
MSESQVWFVTGARSNFGLALIRALLASNRRVVATARNLSARPLPLAPSDSLLTLELDVLQPTQIDAAFKAALGKFGRVDVVVNKTGAPLMGEVEAVSDELARHVFETQFWGPLAVTKAAVKVFRESNPPGAGGRILNITSPLAFLNLPIFGIVGASKAALEAATLSLTRELPKEWNIHALNIEPGAFEDAPVEGAVVWVEQPPVYAQAAPGSGAAVIRGMFGAEQHNIGDAGKMAQALITLAGADRADLPMRAVLGSDVWAYTLGIAEKGVAEMKKGEALADSANRDGVDAEAVKQMAKMFVSAM